MMEIIFLHNNKCFCTCMWCIMWYILCCCWRFCLSTITSIQSPNQSEAFSDLIRPNVFLSTKLRLRPDPDPDPRPPARLQGGQTNWTWDWRDMLASLPGPNQDRIWEEPGRAEGIRCFDVCWTSSALKTFNVLTKVKFRLFKGFRTLKQTNSDSSEPSWRNNHEWSEWTFSAVSWCGSWPLGVALSSQVPASVCCCLSSLPSSHWKNLISLQLSNGKVLLCSKMVLFLFYYTWCFIISITAANIFIMDLSATCFLHWNVFIPYYNQK